MSFVYPVVLWAVVVPLLLFVYLIATNKDALSRVYSEEMLKKLRVNHSALDKNTRRALLLFATILLSLALARPVINPQEQKIEQEIIPVVLALDVSKSMLAQDIYPNRLEFARKKMTDIIREADSNIAIGIVVFAKSAYMVSPLTQDFASLMFMVQNMNQGLHFDGGSNIFDTLKISQNLLKQYRSKNIIFITDGGNNTHYQDELEYATNHHLNIYTLFSATKKPTPIKLPQGEYLSDKDGNIVTLSRNDSFASFSKQSGGGSIEYTLDNHDIEQILSSIRQKSQKHTLKSQKHTVYTELFYYPLALALVCMLFAFSSMPRKKIKHS